MDIFFPFEPMRVGLQNIVESFSPLEYGGAAWMQEAWERLEEQKDEMGRVILDGTPRRSYPPKEKVKKASKWAAFYMLLAKAHGSDR